MTIVKLMSINRFRNCPQWIRLGALFVFISFTFVAAAQVSDNAPAKVETELLLSADKGVEMQLEVRGMPLAQVLETIISKSKVPIHYSVLPEGLVTATCVGSSLKQVLECLLDHKADLIVRSHSNSGKQDNNTEQVAEAWILGSKMGGAVAKVECPVIGQGSLTFKQNEEDEAAMTAQTEQLLKAAQSKNPAERAEAMNSLLSGGRKGDPAVKAALEQGLSDQDERVRAQAISSFSRREGSGAAAALQQALYDASVNVRLMAVDGINDDTALLQQAINDSDETIRVLAATKLEALTQANKTAP